LSDGAAYHDRGTIGLVPSPKLNFRVPQSLADQLERHAARTDRKQTAVVVEALREYFATRNSRDAEDLAWRLNREYSPGAHLAATATFEVTPDLEVSVSIEAAGKTIETPPLSQFVDVVARQDGAQIVIEMHGLPADPDFAGITLPVGSLNAAGGTLSIRLEDLAPSLAEAR
jgi:predicted transcriptional regulator